MELKIKGFLLEQDNPDFMSSNSVGDNNIKSIVVSLIDKEEADKIQKYINRINAGKPYEKCMSFSVWRDEHLKVKLLIDYRKSLIQLIRNVDLLKTPINKWVPGWLEFTIITRRYKLRDENIIRQGINFYIVSIDL